MNTAEFSSPVDIFGEAKRKAYIHALLQPKSAIILSIAIVMMGFSLMDILTPRSLWWLWLVFGVAGAGAMVMAAVADEKFVHGIALKQFYAYYDKSKLRMPELKQSVSLALDYHRLLFREIANRPQAPLGALAADMDALVAGIYRVAYAIDNLVSNERIHKYLQTLIDQQAAQATSKSPQSLEDFAHEIIPIKDTQASEQFAEKRRLLENVCSAVITARGQLQDTLTNISAVHRRVASSSTWQGESQADWSFVDTVHETFTYYVQGLEDNAIAIDNIYYTCTVATMAHS
jgi:hypothetical protein